MELNEYQKKAMTTCMESSNNFSYMMLNLVGEVGEFASKVAKGIRKGYYEINSGENLKDEEKESHLFIRKDRGYELEEIKADVTLLKKEAGDILWQLAGLCSVMGWSLEDIAQQNLDKLASRQERGKIDGDGDNR